MSRLFLSDVDGTLLVDGVFSPSDAAAIRKFQASGGLFGLVTGRDEAFCRRLLGDQGIVPDCLICDNGARVLVKETEVFSSLVESDGVKLVLDHLDPEVCIPFVTMPDGWHRFAKRRYGQDVFERVQQLQPELRYFHESDLDDLLDGVSGVPSLSVYVPGAGDADHVLEACSLLRPEWRWNKSSPDYVEASRSDKAEALKELLGVLDVSWVGFAGDGPNDVPVFRMLCHTWCMEAAPETVKKLAARTCESVGAVLERME